MDITPLDKNSSEQLYLQIRRMIIKAIREQELQPRQRVPSVNELSEATEVSRMTVRQALMALINEGYLYTVPGKGTFVADRPHIEQDLQHLMGWTEEIQAQGMRPATRVISVDTIPADRAISRHLNLAPGAEIYRIVRVRYADAFPLSVERAYLACKRFPGLDQLLHNVPSLYGILHQSFGVRPTRALQYLEAGEADQQTAELLDLQPGKPVLLSERITYAGPDDPIEYVSGATRPGFVRYKTELVAGRGTTVRQVIMPKE
jgi:GntR family transcriptional regulator